MDKEMAKIFEIASKHPTREEILVDFPGKRQIFMVTNLAVQDFAFLGYSDDDLVQETLKINGAKNGEYVKVATGTGDFLIIGENAPEKFERLFKQFIPKEGESE